MVDTALNIWDSTAEEFDFEIKPVDAPNSQGKLQAPAKDILVLGSLLAVLQVLDGILTGIGMYYFGTSAEGNFLLRVLMESFGYIPALITAKAIAIAVIAALCFLADQVRWLKPAMAVMILIYLGAAIIPWTMIISTHLL